MSTALSMTSPPNPPAPSSGNDFKRFTNKESVATDDFERFYRVDKSHSKETGGTGLGFSIVKHAVAYHGGTIKLESKLNEGTTITVEF